MRILIIGSGGREHAIAWKVAKNKNVEKIFCAPGNGGTFKLPKCENINIIVYKKIAKFAVENKIDLTIVGPEQHLCDGIVDLFKKHNLRIFGPNQKAAQLEGSKIYSKDFMKKHNVACGKSEWFTDFKEACAYLEKTEFPTVIKADGLAGGKGVAICTNKEHATEILHDCLVRKIFGASGSKVLIEEYLAGIEASIICMCDGKTIVPFVSAKDHKQVFEFDQGPNTGGMGVIAPNPFVTKKVMADIQDNIIAPTLDGIKKEKLDFCGSLFIGVMITENGSKCLEYNTRLGDPETQSILPLMKSDLVDAIEACINQELSNFKFKWRKQACINVVLCSNKYPSNDYEKNIIVKTKDFIQLPWARHTMFVAGAEYKEPNVLRSTGGRILSVVSHSCIKALASRRAYKIIAKISNEKTRYRKDIGNKKIK